TTHDLKVDCGFRRMPVTGSGPCRLGDFTRVNRVPVATFSEGSSKWRQARLPVREILEVLRLQAAGVEGPAYRTAVGSALSTVQECLRRAREAGWRGRCQTT